MAATIADLLRGKPDPVTCVVSDKVKDILALMIKHDYSQLPIIDVNEKPIGLVTSDSIVRALHNFGVTTENLCVKDAMVKRPSTFYPSDDVFDLLDDLAVDDVGLVVDAQDKLIGIVTMYDTTAYLRQRAQDIMIVQEIEEMIKSYTLAAFTTSAGDVDISKQKAAIADITPSNASAKGKFRKALVHYLSQQGNGNHQLNQTILDEAFTAHLFERPSIKPFDKLTLGEYILLLLHQSRWPQYSQVFSIEQKALRRLLDAVRTTRNALAHFRDDITPQQREELRFCKEWLARHENAIASIFSANTDTVASPLDQQETEPTVASIAMTPLFDTASIPGNLASEEVVPEEEIVHGSESRYEPLIQFLLAQPRENERVTLSFDDIDAMLGEHKLPDSARRYRAWWANDSVSHSQSQQWLNANWRVAALSITDERVTFARSKQRERAYIEFFSALLSNLEAAAPGVFRMPSPDGYSWIVVRYVANGSCFSFSFTQTKRFRVEFYIDVGEKDKNKQLFDMLRERSTVIEQEFGEPLSWERIDTKRACRIARYYPGTITDNTGTLANLRARGIEAMLRLRVVIERHLNDVIPAVRQEQTIRDEEAAAGMIEEPVV